MSRILASVRSLAEARVVASAGVPWIDLKEPAAGALGAVPPAVMRAVVEAFGASHVVSATIGDCWDTPGEIPARVANIAATGVAYAKVGLFAHDLEPALCQALRAAAAAPCGVIAVCFAERPPRAADIKALAESGLAGLMLDTADKHGPGLTGLMSLDELAAFVREVQARGLLCGLAGRLARHDLPALLPLGADYLGFRSALCADSARVGELDHASVRVLMADCQAPAAPAVYPTTPD